MASVEFIPGHGRPSHSETTRHWKVGLNDSQNNNASCGVVPQNKHTFVPQLRYIPKVLHRRTLIAADIFSQEVADKCQLFIRKHGPQIYISLGQLDYDGVHLARVPGHILNIIGGEWRIGLVDTEQSPGVVALLLYCLQSCGMSQWRAKIQLKALV